MPRFTICAVAIVLAVLTSCKKGENGSTSTSKVTGTGSGSGAVTVTAVRVEGSVSAPATITVNGIADEDGATDDLFHVGFRLDGASDAHSLSIDGNTGLPEPYSFAIVISDGADMTGRTVDVTFDP
jgi:hypothetical protein